MNLTVRRQQPELMDAPDLDSQLHAEALCGLRRLNALSRSAHQLIDEISALPNPSGEPLRVLDLACGGGDVALKLEALAAARGVALHVEGRDISALAVELARAAADAARSPVIFGRSDLLAEPLPGGFDVLYCTLFLHHLEEAEALGLLRRMKEAAGRMVIIQDLSRSRLGFVLAWAAARLFTTSPIVHVDAPLSVEGAFTPEEALELAERAGLQRARVARCWPERFSLTWRRA